MKKVWKGLGTVAFWAGWAGIFAYLRFSKRTKVLVTHKNSVLLVKNWLGPDEWSLPGGGGRWNEDPAVAAIRELEEETGIKINGRDLKFKHQKKTNVHGLKFFYSCYHAELTSLCPIGGHRLDVSEVQWFKISDLEKVQLSPESKAIVADWYN